MVCKKQETVRFQRVMTLGNFVLEGSSSYISREVVICIPDGKSKMRSHVPPEDEAIMGVKRKAGEVFSD